MLTPAPWANPESYFLWNETRPVCGSWLTVVICGQLSEPMTSVFWNSYQLLIFACLVLYRYLSKFVGEEKFQYLHFIFSFLCCVTSKLMKLWEIVSLHCCLLQILVIHIINVKKKLTSWISKYLCLHLTQKRFVQLSVNSCSAFAL